MEKKLQTAAIYSRKSKFTGQGESVENQVELCRQYLLARGDPTAVAARVYEDEGFSGGNLDRPQFQNMMRAARAGELSAIVVYRLDRISRNIGDFAGLIQELDELNISFVSIREQFDTNSPMGRAMMYIASVFSQLERETIAERIRDNMRELAKTGRWLGGITPTGFASEQVRRIALDGKTRKACMLKLLPEEAALVKVIFQNFLETESLTQTDAFLLEHGYRTKNEKPFTRFAIRNILTNPVYMTADREARSYWMERGAELFSEEAAFDGVHGLMVYNRTLQKSGKANQVRPVREWIIAVGKHPGLIAGFQWIQVQKILERNGGKGYRKPRSHMALLSGLVICGACGGTMRPKQTGRRNENGEPVYQYQCTVKERSHSKCCHIRNLDGNALDTAVFSQLRGLNPDRRELIRQLQAGKTELQRVEKSMHREWEQLDSRQKELEKEIQSLLPALAGTAGTSAETYMLAQIDQLHREKERLIRYRDELQKSLSQKRLENGRLYEIREMLSTFAQAADGMSLEEKRWMVRNCVEKIVWDGETVHLYFLGEKWTALESGPAAEVRSLGENSK